MFGPVMIIMRLSSPSSTVSFGMKRLSRMAASSTGWRPPRMISVSLSSTWGLQ